MTGAGGHALDLATSFVEAWAAGDREALAAHCVEGARLWDPVGDWCQLPPAGGGSARTGRPPPPGLRHPVLDVLVDGGDVIVTEGRCVLPGAEDTPLTAVLRLRGELIAEARLYFDPGDLGSVDDEQTPARARTAAERESRP